MHTTLQLVLILLAAAVIVVAAFRRLGLPAMLAYLLIGICVGPHALAWVPDSQETHFLAEFGVVFLMFSIGLEFSLPKLVTMRRQVFGLGGAQVVLTVLVTGAVAMAAGLPWQAAVALGGAIAMSSTAIVSKMLEDRVELQSRHGAKIIGVLLFQDLAVVPFLIVVPEIAAGSGELGSELLLAALKAILLLAALLYLGQRLLRPLFHAIAVQKSPELFMLTVLLVTLGLAYLTGLAGLSLALGAFLAGMLISETEFRYQVESDIKPFRDVLLGLFFITIGMQLDLGLLLRHIAWVLVTLTALMGGKLLIVMAIVRLFGAEQSVALRTGLALAQGGEFGFVLLSQAGAVGLIPEPAMQIVLAAMVLSMLAAPMVIHYSEAIVRRYCADEWTHRAMEVHEIAARTLGTSHHVIICGYGRSGQNLARFLEKEDIAYIALDNDATRVRAAAAAGERVVYGDAARREVLMAAGIKRAKALVVTYADVPSAVKVLNVVHELRQNLPVIVRTLDDAHLEELRQAGATEVVPEVLEGTLMLVSHTLMLIGLPLARVVKRVRTVREQRYDLLRGFFHGVTDEALDTIETAQPRLHSVTLDSGAAAVGKTLGELDLDGLYVEVTAVRRRNIRGFDPLPETRLMEGDVLVLMGTPDSLEAAEARLVQG